MRAEPKHKDMENCREKTFKNKVTVQEVYYLNIRRFKKRIESFEGT